MKTDELYDIERGRTIPMSATTRRTFLAGAGTTFSGMAASTPTIAGQRRGDFIPAEKREMQEMATDLMAKNDVPALSVAIAKDDRLVYAEAFGTADGKDEKLTPGHRFRIASVSKPVTSVAAMGLIERGKLRLSDRVFGKGAVLGTDFGKSPYGLHVEAVTIEHLLTHTAGGWSNSGPDPDPMFTHPRMNHAALISWTLDNLPLHDAPGAKHAYSNFGFCVLGRVIEKITGTGYAEYVRKEVLIPCGIRAMEIAGNTLADRKPMEVVYHGQGNENPYGMQVARMDAHGGWIATPSDLVRLLVRVDGFPGKRDILKPETIKVMTTGSTTNPGYAKGWIVNRQNNWWHNGSLPGTITLMVRTSGGMCWAALTNTRKPGSRLSGDLDRLVWNMVGKVSVWPGGELNVTS